MDIPQTEAHLVIFSLAGEFYGVDIVRVQSIIPYPQITVVPGTPHFVEGIINLRGEIVPVVDMRARFELAPPEASHKRVIVIVELHGQQVGMVVDKVTEVRKIPAGQIEPPAPLLVGVDSAYLAGIARLEDRVVILLDLDRIFSPGEQQALRQAA
ncbi:MAG TPA: chemotaxis protein CheW [Roseiflexaceae bacterium]|nr:chemotaxis protein CheW [Roseiflexaceae bacterium]